MAGPKVRHRRRATPARLRPGRWTDPDHRPRAAAAPARHRHPTTPTRPPPPAARVRLATPPPAPRPPSPPTWNAYAETTPWSQRTTAAV